MEARIENILAKEREVTENVVKYAEEKASSVISSEIVSESPVKALKDAAEAYEESAHTIDKIQLSAGEKIEEVVEELDEVESNNEKAEN